MYFAEQSINYKIANSIHNKYAESNIIRNLKQVQTCCKMKQNNTLRKNTPTRFV